MKRILLAGLLLVATAVVAAPAQAVGCADSSVTVVVQFKDGHTETGCTSGDPHSGLEALTLAGFTWKPVVGQPSAVCTINGSPDGNCWGGDYWAYFHAKPGGSWSYASTGGGGYDPKPGSVEGWRFGTGAAPETKPPGEAVSTPTPKPTPTAKPTKKPTRKPTQKPGSVATQPDPSAPTSATTNASTGPDASPSGTATQTATADSTAPSGSPSPGTTASVDAAPGTTSQQKPASEPDKGISWIWGVVLLGVLAVAGGAVAVRRRG
jgi:hypothetical protein